MRGKKEKAEREREKRAPAIWGPLQPELPNKVWGFESPELCQVSCVRPLHKAPLAVAHSGIEGQRKPDRTRQTGFTGWSPGHNLHFQVKTSSSLEPLGQSRTASPSAVTLAMYSLIHEVCVNHVSHRYDKMIEAIYGRKGSFFAHSLRIQSITMET